MGSIRIIGGAFRGRKFPVLDAEGLRPTTDRVRETVFNWLQFDIPNANCLDVFSGSGAFGFESLSRGASTVTLLEINKACAQQLKKNAELIKTNSIIVHNVDALKYLSDNNNSKSYDLVFLDPPYRKGLLEKSADLLVKNNYLHSSSLIYVEYAVDEHVELPESWLLLKTKIAGQCCYNLYKSS